MMQVRIGGKLLTVFPFNDLLLSDREKKDGRQNNNSTDPKSSGHFVHITKKNEGHNDAIHRLQAADECYPEGRKFAHYRYACYVCKRCADGSRQEKIAHICTL